MTKVAVVILSDLNDSHANLGRVVNGLQLVREATEAGDDVQLIFDGAGAASAVAIADPEHRLHRLYTIVDDNIAGVCRYCARAFHVLEQAEALQLPLLAEYNQHPSLRQRVADGYEVVTF